jgi:hypothetical protein
MPKPHDQQTEQRRFLWSLLDTQDLLDAFYRIVDFLDEGDDKAFDLDRLTTDVRDVVAVLDVRGIHITEL